MNVTLFRLSVNLIGVTDTTFASVCDAVARASRRLASMGLVVGTAGNVSCRSGDAVAVTATGVRLEHAEAEQVTVVDLDGRPLAGQFAATSELALHLGIYQQHGVGAVVHAHSPQATAASLVLDELPCVHYQMLTLGGSIRVAPFAPFGTDALACSVLDALEGKKAALMANHGCVAIGETLDAAMENILLLEWACELYLRAAAAGHPRVLDDDQQQAVVEAAVRQRYGSTRLLDEEERP